MRVTWIIGNGFDLNLGLRTSYRDFIERAYLASPDGPAKRRLLDSISKVAGGDVQNWSDLEELSGIITQEYDVSEKDLFFQGFEDMLAVLDGYLAKEQEAFCTRPPSHAMVDEFWGSIARLGERLPPMELAAVGDFQDARENNSFDFISLNYTDPFDRLLEAAKREHRPFDRRMNMYRDSAGEVLHVHGTVGPAGGLVFGVSDDVQVANPAFALDPEFAELWVKTRRNAYDGFYRTQEAFDRIFKSDLVVVFGCSLGKTDEYLWHEVVSGLAADEGRRLLVFDHLMLPKASVRGRLSQIRRDEVLSRLLSYGAVPDASHAEVCSRICVESARLVFRFDSRDGAR